MLLKQLKSLAKLFAIVLLLTQAAPSYARMSDIHGNPNELNTHVGKGKWTVVKVWKSDCGICMSTMKETNSAQYILPNTKVVGVSLDGDARVAKRSLNKFRVNFTNLVSNTNEFNRYIKTSTKRNIVGYPTYMIYAPNGKLKAMQTGDIKPSELRRYIKGQMAL